MRHRSSGDDFAASSPNAVSLGSLRRFDVYSKVHDDYNIKTSGGGIISMISMLIIGSLLISEVASFFSTAVADHIIVDTTVNQRLPIGINITFPHLRCDEVSIDTVDSMMDNQININGSITKLDLDADGYDSGGVPTVKPGTCLDCLEAQEYVDEPCCNTCSDLKMAYVNAGIPYHNVLDNSQQCKFSVGCQVHGDVLVSKVGGNVHVALGHSKVQNGKHVHEFNVREVSHGFNTSHVIHRLEFGERVAGLIFPLEGTGKIVKHGAFMFHYYIKLVPTLYLSQSRTVYTHQYAVTESEKNVQSETGELAGLPGVFFVYEFTPFMVQKVETSRPLTDFITAICAIIGGVFVVAGMVDAAIYKLSKKLRRQTAGKD